MVPAYVDATETHRSLHGTGSADGAGAIGGLAPALVASGGSFRTMGRRYDTVTLLTDYGLVDEFVGVMKSVLRDLAPHVAIVDLTHGVTAYDVRGGALCLGRSVAYLPEGVVVAVVDPGVGTDRRAIAVEVADGAGVFVGPDNGLLAPAVALLGGAQRAVSLTNPDYRLDGDGGATFDGRDVFAPAAAHLCNGVDLLELGDEVDSSTLLPAAVPLPELTDGRLRGQVLWVDGFGNCQLNIGPDELDQIASGEDVVRLLVDGAASRTARRVTSFAELSQGAIGIVTDSYGMLALVLDRRSAADELGLAVADDVTLAAIDDGDGRDDGVRVELTSR